MKDFNSPDRSAPNVPNTLGAGPSETRFPVETEALSGAAEAPAIQYRQLDESLQSYWRSLAVFPGGFDGAAARAVWNLDSDTEAGSLLERFLSKGMVQRETSLHRFNLPDQTRQFAHAQIGLDEIFEYGFRHATHFAAVLKSADTRIREGGEACGRGLTAFDLERENIEAGQQWAAAHRSTHPSAAQLCSAYPRLGARCLVHRLNARERIAWLEAALDAARTCKDRQAEGSHLGNLGVAYADLRDWERAIHCYREALAIARARSDRRGEAWTLDSLGLAHADRGDAAKAVGCFEEGLAIWRELDDRHEVAHDLFNLGLACADHGEYQRAAGYLEKALGLSRDLGHRQAEADVLGSLGIVFRKLRQPRKAIRYQEQYLEIARAVGDRQGEGNALGNLGNAWANLGEPLRAIAYYEQALEMARHIGDVSGEGNSNHNLAVELAKIDRHDEAIACAERAIAIYDAIASPHAAVARTQLEELLKTVTD